MSTLKPSILINPQYATNNLDTQQAGWYQIQPTSSNVALRVSHSNIGLSGEIRLNTKATPPIFQGNNGSGWVSFNATRGPTGPSGRDFTNQVNFNNLTSTTNQSNTVSLGSIFATTYVNVGQNISNVNIRSLQGSSSTINSNLSVDSIFLTQNSNVITIKSSPVPYTWDFTENKNTVSYLKSGEGENSKSWGETSKWIVQSGQTVYKGQAVTLVQDINSSTIVIAPLTYTTLNNITQISPFNMLGIATNTASSGNQCVVCTKGITTVKCTNQITNDFIRSDSVSNIGIAGIVGTDGYIFNNQYSTPDVIYIKAGYFLEGNAINNTIAANDNYALFYVDPVIYTNIFQLEQPPELPPGPSDKRLKENIANISQDDKDKLLQLVPKTYNFIKDEQKIKRYGLIAQEVEELFPEIVKTNSVNDIKALNYIDLIPLLLEKVKELDTTINELLHKTNTYTNIN